MAKRRGRGKKWHKNEKRVAEKGKILPKEGKKRLTGISGCDRMELDIRETILKNTFARSTKHTRVRFSLSQRAHGAYVWAILTSC